ncbi:MAG TPA: YwmB family TATA-box binding protein [Candidatus Atribacteria bacterium]|nr:YwmB family TATA-box binding protein [Candidatus Atribacteria bacterium]HPT78368.1 YwmB family TATA-box binding protein [Candidatus Atribacteria bacterium]
MKRYFSVPDLLLTALMLIVTLALIVAPAAGLACMHAETTDTGRPDPGRIFDDLGIDLDAIQIKGWAKLDDGYPIDPQTDLLAGKILNSSSDGNVSNEIGIDGVSIRWGLYKGYSPAGGGPGTFMTVEVLIDNPSEAVYNSVHCALTGFLKGLSRDSFVSTLYMGTLPGRLTGPNMDRVCRQIFASCRGKITEGVKADGFISLTGWSDFIEGSSLSADGRKINLNVALRYSEYDKATHVWLGTPIIFTGY